MVRTNRTLLCLLAGLMITAAAWAKDQKTDSSIKVCVAGINNRTATSLFEERMAARLTKGLVDNKLAAVGMDSLTTDERDLRPTVDNGNEMKRQECDFLLLTQVRDPRHGVAESRAPSVHIGGRIPSIDASDPMGGQSGPVYRDNLEIDYALFRPGKLEAQSKASIEAPASANVSDSLVLAMDRLANRVAHDVKKK